MSRIRKFFALAAERRRLLVQAAILLAGIRVGLLVLPFITIRSALAWLAAGGGGRRRSGSGTDGTEWAVWAVEAVGSRIPAIGTCLTQALAAHVLLGRMGQHTDLRIGVKRDATGKFGGHAWLERDGVVLIGGSCHTSYAAMPVLHGLERRL
jgi:hypothetical protein